MIRVVGLGTRDGEMSIRGAVWIDDADVVIVKTALTDTYNYFKEEGVEHVTLDHIFEESEDFDDLNRKVVDFVLTHRDKNVAFCVDGSGVDDRSVIALKATPNLVIEIIAGVSRETKLLVETPSSSFTRVSSYDIASDKAFSYDKTKPLIITDIDNLFIASEVKEVLSRLIGDEQNIVFTDNDGAESMEVYELDRLDAYDYSCSVTVQPLHFTNQKAYGFDDLMRIMYKLRGRNGCDWDKDQTHASLRKNAIEEAYELVEAIDNEDIENIIEESGDVILQGVFHSVIGEDEGEFEAHEVISKLCYKLVSRHKHIFGDQKASTPEEALKVWEAAKAEEKGTVTSEEKMLSIAKALPSGMRAEKVQRIASKMNLDFANTEEIINIINKEINEFMSDNNKDLEIKGGDILFSVINLLRHKGIESEVALSRSVDKFLCRVSNVEKIAKTQNIDIKKLSPEKLNNLWKEAKI